MEITFNKNLHKYFTIHNPLSLSESCFFYGFFLKKVFNIYHQFVIQLINTFQPLFDNFSAISTTENAAENIYFFSHATSFVMARPRCDMAFFCSGAISANEQS